MVAGLCLSLAVSTVRAELPQINDLPNDLPQGATSVKEWLAQVEAATVQVNGVSLNPTPSELEIVLQTAEGKPLQVDATKFRTEGNRLIADIPNAVLTLTDAQAFNADNPTEDIAAVQVVQQDASTIQIRVIGKERLPKTAVTLKTGEFIYSLNPEGEESEEEELVVTGEGEDSYFVPDTSVGTRTDTPLRDIPASIQIVPRQVIQDTQSRTITQALENVPGVISQGSGVGFSRDYFTIRGFDAYNGIVNGLPDPQITSDGIFFNVERVEVLRGPASVLYGESGGSALGGTINYVTRRPLRDPYFEAEVSVGNYNFYQGTIDVSAPLNRSKSALGRFIAGYRNNDSVIDFDTSDVVGFAPSLSFQLGSRSKLIVEGDVVVYEQDDSGALPIVGTILPNPNGKVRRSFNPVGPDVVRNLTYNGRVGYQFEHQFNENLTLRNAFRYTFYGDDDRDGAAIIFQAGVESDNRTVTRNAIFGSQFFHTFLLDTNLLSKFKTGSVEHQILSGFSLTRSTTDIAYGFGFPAPPVDMFDPVYDQNVVFGDINSSRFITKDIIGIYVQDQITLLDNLKLLVGGRFDIVDNRATDRLTNTKTAQTDTAFSPRVGLVYQPIQPISLYASYAQSFNPVLGVTAFGDFLKPERGTQYEVGIKSELNSQLSTTLALYELTRSNVTTRDLLTPGFSVQSGKQRSRGIEFDITGEILPGWNIIAGYAYTDARVVEDNDIPVGNRLFNAPEHAVNFWTTYRIQRGIVKGLGFGLGLYYIGERPADNANTVNLPSFIRTDAAIFYERDQLRVSLNVRNLFDVENFTAGNSSQFVTLGTPFTIQGSLSWKF
jgi:iron complex outermembrane receptor protein